MDFFFRRSLLAATVLEFEARSIAPLLQDFEIAETFALNRAPFPAAGSRLRRFAAVAARCVDPVNASQPMRGILNYLHSGNWPQVFAFDGRVFYEKRWALLNHLEQQILFPDALARAAGGYVGGTGQLEKDCRIYLGADPHQLVLRRKIEIGDLWLRSGNSLAAVAEHAGFSSTRGFACAYGGVKSRRCSDALNGPSLREMDAEKMAESLRPWFWAAPRPLRIEIPEMPHNSSWLGLDPSSGFDPIISGYASIKEFEAARTKSLEDLRARGQVLRDESHHGRQHHSHFQRPHEHILLRQSDSWLETQPGSRRLRAFTEGRMPPLIPPRYPKISLPGAIPRPTPPAGFRSLAIQSPNPSSTA